MSRNFKADLQHCPTDDGVDTLYSAQYGQTFHSRHGALLEAEHVFLRATGVKARLAAGRATVVLEVGFGTGLNFLLTAGESRLMNAPLRYVALEKALPPVETLVQLNHGDKLTAADIRRAFLAWRNCLPACPSGGTFEWRVSQSIVLELVIGDAAGASIPRRGYHAIYHDAFSPAANPELWTPEFFARLFAVLTPGGALATYSAKGAVRRALQAAGFQAQKLPGPPGKCEMLVGLKPPADFA